MDAGTMLGYVGVVKGELDPCAVTAAYVNASLIAAETDLKQVLPHLRDAVAWKLLRYSGERHDKFWDTVKFAFGNVWGLTLHSQMMMSAMKALSGQKVVWCSSPRRAWRKPVAD